MAEGNRGGRARQARRAVRALLAAIGEDPARPEWLATADLVAEALPELFCGVGRDPAAAVSPLAGGGEGEVAIEGIPFLSWCPHHLLPYHGTADVRYLPAGGRVAGLGDLARAVEIASRRPVLQERLTEDIADALWRTLAPRRLEVRLRATQLCLVARGARAVGAQVESLARRGGEGMD
jgi:GTP cyclohydrolase I